MRARNTTEGGYGINRWWVRDLAGILQLEMTDRGSDLDLDLNAPLTNEVGGQLWNYDVRPGASLASLGEGF